MMLGISTVLAVVALTLFIFFWAGVLMIYGVRGPATVSGTGPKRTRTQYRTFDNVWIDGTGKPHKLTFFMRLVLWFKFRNPWSKVRRMMRASGISVKDFRNGPVGAMPDRVDQCGRGLSDLRETDWGPLAADPVISDITVPGDTYYNINSRTRKTLNTPKTAWASDEIRLSTAFRSPTGLNVNIIAQVNLNQKDVVVANASVFSSGDGVRIVDGLGNTEPCNIASINGLTNTITMDVDLKGTYLMANNPRLISRNTAGIQEAINSLPAYGGMVVVPRGDTIIYDVIYATRTVKLVSTGIAYMNVAGHDSRLFLAAASTPEAMIWFDGRRYRSDIHPLNHPYFSSVEDILLNGNKANCPAGGEGIRISHWSDIIISHTFVFNTQSHGIRGYYPNADCDLYHIFIENSWVEECNGNAIYMLVGFADMTTRCDGVFVRNCVFYLCQPIYFGCPVALGASKEKIFRCSRIINNELGNQAVTLEGVDNMLVTHNNVFGGAHGILVNDSGGVRRSTNVQIKDNDFNDTTASPAVWLVGDVNHSHVTGNNTVECTRGKIDDSACTGRDNKIEHNMTGGI